MTHSVGLSLPHKDQRYNICVNDKKLGWMYIVHTEVFNM